MLNKKIASALNQQIQKEFQSAYLYLDIANHYQKNSMEGLATWFTIQANEEISHGMKIMGYLQDNNSTVVLMDIPASQKNYQDFLTPLKDALSHEQYITDSINNLYLISAELKDYRTESFLEWFINEQLEEEINAQKLMDKMRMYGGDAQGLMALDHVAGKRQFEEK